MKQVVVRFTTGTSHVLAILLAIVAYSNTYGKDTHAATPKLKPASEVSMAHIVDRLKARPLGASCTTEGMMAYLGIDPISVDWDAESFGRISFFGPLKDPNRSIAFDQKRADPDHLAPDGALLKIEIFDSGAVASLMVWTPSKGLLIPESAAEDTNARYLVDQPVTVPWSPEKSGYLASDLAQRAARWHDSRIAAWNKAFIDDGYTDAKPFLPALEEIGKSHGTYTLRLPKQYKPDGTWGMVIVFGQYSGQYLPLRLRDACERHKCLFVKLSPEWKAPGQIWRNLAQIMDGVATLRGSYKFAPERTALLDFVGDKWAVGFAAALFPEVFRFVALPDYGPLLPGEVGPENGVRYIRSTWSLSTPEWTLLPFPLGWMLPEDWQRNSKLGQRWVWEEGTAMDRTSYEKVLEPAWSAVKIKTTLLPGFRDNETPLIPRRCLQAEVVDALFK